MTERVEELMRLGDWEGALAASLNLLDACPSNAKLQAYVGLCHFKKNQFAEAAPYFRKALLLDPLFWEAALKLAQCLDRMMQYDEALEAAQAALKLRPSDPTVNVLVNGLQRHATEKVTDGWQKSKVRHNVQMSTDE